MPAPWLLVLTLLGVATNGGATGSPWPSGVSVEGLAELTTEGEILFLPQHNSSPFVAVITSRSARPCGLLETELMEVQGYPRIWNSVKHVRILAASPQRVEYEFDVDLVLSPTIKGVVEHPRRGLVVFHDLETNGRFSYFLRPVHNGCQVSYRLYQPEGHQSGFVRLITAIESRATDSSELIGGLASLRGVVRMKASPSRSGVEAAKGELALEALASHGTVVQTIYERDAPLQLRSKRRVARAPAEVLAAIRDRGAYDDRGIMRTAEANEGGGRYVVSYFGGRVAFETLASESGSLEEPGGITILERLVGGDVDDGHWRWHLHPVEGGTEVELLLNVDLPRGSVVMRNLLKQDPAIGYAVPMQLTLMMMSELVGGQPLPRRESVPLAVND
ncbi:MAG: hypothetical protein ACO3JL_12970 [Myxococcota bacterium]